MSLFGTGNIQSVGINIFFRMTGQAQSAISRTESAIGVIKRGLDSLESRSVALTRANQLLGGTLSMAGAIMLGLGKAASTAALGLEKLQISSKAIASNIALSSQALNTQARGFTNVGFSVTEALTATNKLNTVNATWADTNKLAVIANDLAISKNLEYAQVLDLLTDAIAKGSAESLNQLDIGVTNEQLQKRFVAGTERSANSLSLLEKRQMVYNYILERGTFVQGAYADASDSVVVSLRNLQSNSQDAFAAFGQGFLDAAKPLINIVSNLLERFAALDSATLKTVGRLALWVGGVASVSGSIFMMTATFKPLYDILSTIAKLFFVSSAQQKIYAAAETAATDVTARHAAASASTATAMDGVSAKAKEAAVSVSANSSAQLTAIARANVLSTTNVTLAANYKALAANATAATVALQAQTAVLNANTAATAVKSGNANSLVTGTSLLTSMVGTQQNAQTALNTKYLQYIAAQSKLSTEQISIPGLSTMLNAGATGNTLDEIREHFAALQQQTQFLPQTVKSTNLFTKALAKLGTVAPGAAAVLTKIGAFFATPVGIVVGIAAAIAGVAVAIHKIEEAQWKKRLGTIDEQENQFSLYSAEKAAIELARAEATAKAIQGLHEDAEVEVRTPRQLEKAGETYRGEADIEKGTEKLRAQVEKYATNSLLPKLLGSRIANQYAASFSEAIDKAEITSTHDLHRLERVYRQAIREQAWSDVFQRVGNELTEALTEVIKVITDAVTAIKDGLAKIEKAFTESKLSDYVEEYVNGIINGFRKLIGLKALEVPIEISFVPTETEEKKRLDSKYMADTFLTGLHNGFMEAQAAAKAEAQRWTNSDFMSETFLSTPSGANDFQDYVTGKALRGVEDELRSALAIAQEFEDQINAIDNALFSVEIQEHNLDLALRPYEQSLQRVEAAATLILIPLRRQQRALQKLVSAEQQRLEDVRKRHEEENKALEDQIELLEKQLKVGQDRLEMLDWELFIENTKNKIRKQETSARELALKTEKLIQKDSVEAMELQLSKLRDQLEEQKKKQELEVAAAEKQIEAAEKQMSAVDAMIEAEEEKVTYAQEELDLQKAMQQEQRIAIENIKETLSWQQKLVSKEKEAADKQVKNLQDIQEATKAKTEQYKTDTESEAETAEGMATAISDLSESEQKLITDMVTKSGKVVDDQTREVRAKLEVAVQNAASLFTTEGARLDMLPVKDSVPGKALLTPMSKVLDGVDSAIVTWIEDPASGLNQIATVGFDTMVRNINEKLEEITWPGVPDYLQDFMKGNYPGGPNDTGHYSTEADVTAAKGFDGVVSTPTHFLAGEAGPERVSVIPMVGGTGVGAPISRTYANNMVTNNSSNSTTINNNFDVAGTFGQTPTKRSVVTSLELAASMFH